MIARRPWRRQPRNVAQVWQRPGRLPDGSEARRRAPPPLGNPPAWAQRFRVGIVGAGNISEFHIAAVRDVPEVELVGLTDLDPARAEATGARLGVTVHRSLEELVAAGANVIHVLTPPHAHAAMALEAIGLGCHVLVEKPLAEDGADARRIGAAAAARGGVATVNHS